MRRLLPVLALWVLAAPSCDWEHYALMNSIPARGDPDRNPVVHVYLGLDGLGHTAVVKARERGAFQDWNLARFIPMFPATSDASWSRILHAERFSGYEYGHYDPIKDKVYNKALGGMLVHLVPPLEGVSFMVPDYALTPSYYDAFDYHATAYLDALWSYDRPVYGYYRGLDNLFVALAGRSQTQENFFAYVLEADVIGHIRSVDDVTEALVSLSQRIDAFKRNHPERTFVFTLFGDHGMDGVKKPLENVVDFREQLEAAGVVSVDSFRDADKEPGPASVTILHTRTTYVALHVRPEKLDEVARRASTCAAADLVFARGQPPSPDYPEGLVWVNAWREGTRVASFGYEAATDQYWLPADGDWAGLDLPVSFAPGASHGVFSDEALFALSVERTYPDFFFRARTAFEPISVEFPADAVVSFRPTFMSVGFKAPINSLNETGTAGSHGAMDALGSVAALVSEERELPAAVRSDTLLELFPRLAGHLRERGVTLMPGAQGAELDYGALP
ncbi:alkaline phosphatase family protein [Stigmatella sp. ncwal1]|uniref:Alkaline phosphatase family protein n=1 Tax=Stigmatella ashevillensis TaxID=2995309 RepID=A0ABT5DGX1_9BACT|nr:alkaline phosphatase family protein [Stigmatella ashevillena]MDC0712912.1 alkaline phosphatase family protein [Stigmatella ashevillena]